MATAFPSAEAQDRFGSIGFVMNRILVITLITYITIPSNTVMLNVQSIGRIAVFTELFDKVFCPRQGVVMALSYPMVSGMSSLGCGFLQPNKHDEQITMQL